MCPENEDTNPGGVSRTAESASSVTPPPLPKRASNPALSTSSPSISISSASIALFQEAPAPQLAPNASLAEELHFFQALAQQKTEALERARTLYSALEKEYQTLRTKFIQLQNAVPQSQLSELEEERKDLARALAEVEGQYSQFKQSMELELESRKQMAQELLTLKEELEQTQGMAAQMAAERADIAGQLEATTEGYEHCVREAEQCAEENETLRAEIEAYKASFGQHQSSELHLMDAEIKELKARVEASESEQKWLEENLEHSEARVQELEEAYALLMKTKTSENALPSGQKALKAELEATRAELESVRAQLLSPAQQPHWAQQTDELERLRGTVALLKKRLLVAEAAAEAAAGLKSKIARLEGMLRQSGH